MKFIKKNMIWIGVAVLFLLVVAYMKRQKIKAWMVKKNGALEEDAVLIEDTVLKKGSTGAEVAELQRMLNADGATPQLVVDGIFGVKTEAALMQIKGVNSTSLSIYPTLIGAKALSAVRDIQDIQTAKSVRTA